MRDVMRADQNLDVDAEVVRVAQDLDDAAHGPVAVFAKVEDFGGDDHAVQVFDRMLTVIARAPTRSTVTCREGIAMSSGISIHWRIRSSCGIDEIAGAPDAELADHSGMRAAQHAHDLAVGAPSRSMRLILRNPRGRRAWRVTADSLGM